jgi:RimJ/RimL family protein N-acetyltransferase
MMRGSLVTLRPAREQDRRAIYQWLAESDLTPSMLGHFPDAPVPSWDQFCVDFFEGTSQEVGRSFIIEVDGDAVGHVGYDGMDLARSIAELDIWLRSSEVCGRGYGSDALVTLTRALCETFGVTGRHHPEPDSATWGRRLEVPARLNKPMRIPAPTVRDATHGVDWNCGRLQNTEGR